MARSKSPTVDPVVADALNEYLTWANFEKTAAAFATECERKSVKLVKSSAPAKTKKSSRKSQDNAALQKKLNERFEKGDVDGFFRTWRDVFPKSSRDQPAKVLEFYLRVYFATFPLRQPSSTKKDYQEAITGLKRYLEDGDGTRLSNATELVPYFALPYVNNPQQHPLFKDLTQEKWVGTVRDKLQRHLKRKFDQLDTSSAPKVVAWMNAYEGDSSPPAPSEKSKQPSEAVQKQYSDLQKDYHKLIGIASELVDALEESIQGKPISLEKFAEISTRLVESNQEATRKMKKNDATGKDDTRHRDRSNNRKSRRESPTKQSGSPTKDDGSKTRAKSPEPKKADSSSSPTDNTKSSSKGSQSPKKTTDDFMPAPPNVNGSSAARGNELAKADILDLNYPKIATQLTRNPTARESALLLQALRQLITRTNTTSERDAIIEAFARKDLLSLKSPRPITNIVAAIYNSEAPDAKHQLARLINALASIQQGRAYLLSNAKGADLLGQLVLALRAKRVKDHSSDHTLAALQKLSLRRQVQKQLIQAGLIEWLVQYLANHAKLGDFALEYATALLMNLTLNSNAKQSCIRQAEQLCKLMIGLVSHTNAQIHPYVNGVLYSILAIPRVRTKANELGMEAVLEAQIEQPQSTDDTKQLPFVLKQLRGELGDKEFGDENESEPEDDEEDYLETELDSTDTLKAKTNELHGEALLRDKYVIIGGSNGKRTNGAAPSKVTAARRDEDERAPPGTVPQSAEPNYARRTISRSTYTMDPDPDRPRPLIAANAKLTVDAVGRNATIIPGRSGNRKGARSPPSRSDQPDASSPGRKAAGTTRPQPNIPPAPPARKEPSQSRRVEPKASGILRPQTAVIKRSTSLTRETKDDKDKLSSKENLGKQRTTSYKELSARDAGDGAESPPKYPIAFEPQEVAPVVTDKLPRRIPEDANPYEYNAAFGSRPKVMRTPDIENVKKRNTMIVMY